MTGCYHVDASSCAAKFPENLVYADTLSLSYLPLGDARDRSSCRSESVPLVRYRPQMTSLGLSLSDFFFPFSCSPMLCKFCFTPFETLASAAGLLRFGSACFAGTLWFDFVLLFKTGHCGGRVLGRMKFRSLTRVPSKPRYAAMCSTTCNNTHGRCPYNAMLTVKHCLIAVGDISGSPLCPSTICTSTAPVYSVHVVVSTIGHGRMMTLLVTTSMGRNCCVGDFAEL